MFGTGGRSILSALLFLLPVLLVAGCKTEKPVKQKSSKPGPSELIRSKHPVLTSEERAELLFPEDIVTKVALSADAEPEPFFVTYLVPSQNLKGDRGIERRKLAGFSVRTQNADELIASYRPGLRVRGYLIFKSYRGYGSLPDIVTVVKGNSSYDLLKIMATESVTYRLNTKAIIAWLKARQKSGSFFITGAGPDWIEAQFVRRPANMRAFAGKIFAFAPDVRRHGPKTPGALAESMKKTNGFYLVWD